MKPEEVVEAAFRPRKKELKELHVRLRDAPYSATLKGRMLDRLELNIVVGILAIVEALDAQL